MADLVATVPKDFWWEWLWEGELPGDPLTGEEWGFFLGGPQPPIEPGERLYIVGWGRLRGYSPVTRVVRTDRGWAIGREGGAVAVTIDRPIRGFRGWQRRDWERSEEKPFPEWMWEGVGKVDGEPPEEEMHQFLLYRKRSGFPIAPNSCHPMCSTCAHFREQKRLAAPAKASREEEAR